ncbi:MAG: hypothetical protein A2Y23_13525 [Clostridiales bacterium GWB2_37_7]|nr:MAG: hypothetical protein A2Y23_13525 [Clostridiales bacterium GWB2_37_7]
MEEVVLFLLRAKRATYAGKGPESVSSRPKSHDLEYVEDDLKYIDTYLGGEKFAGEEALWKNDVPFWSMNYCGRVVAEGFNGDFLKEALSQVQKEMPYRGPNEYKKDGFSYKCTVNGDFDWFEGFEEIFLNDKKIYECMFHGGAIK